MGILVGDSAEEQSTSQGLPKKIIRQIRALVLLEKIIWCFGDLGRGLGLEAILD